MIIGGIHSQQLKGSQIIAELKYLLNLLTLCWHFSKKPFPLFLEETGYSEGKKPNFLKKYTIELIKATASSCSSRHA